MASLNETSTTCLECGTELTSRRESYRYRALPGVTLLDVAVYRCPTCGASEVEIPQIAELDHLLARELIFKAGRLVPEEIVFLRKFRGWSGSDLADRMCVAPETVSRWENGKQAIGLPAELLLRMTIAVSEPVRDYAVFDSLPGLVKSHDASSPQLRRWAYDGAWRESDTLLSAR